MNKIYPTLYARSTTGKILTWFVEQQDEKYRITSGQEDGKKVVSEWSVAIPKNVGKANETTGTEQATAEIGALYTKKKKQKYKDNVNDVDVQTYFKPMLAKKYVDYKDKIDFFDGTWLAQIKFNGVRAVLTKDGAFSRTGERFLTVPHIEDSLKEFFEYHPDEILDGEFYNYDLRQKLNDLISLVRKTVNISLEDLVKSEQIVRYYVYDWSNPSIPAPYNERKDVIDRFILPLYPPYMNMVSDFPVHNEQELMDLFDNVLQDGQEGLMLRKKDSLYENKRSKNLLKMKADDDDTCTVLAIHDGDGNWANKCKTFTVEWNGKIFDASLKGGGMKAAIEIWNNQDQWIGSRRTFLYMGLTGLGVPNYARIDYDNCVPST